MLDVITISAILIVAGVMWRIIKPQGLDADQLRHSLTGIVYNLLLPALVVGVLWSAELGLTSFVIVLMAATGVIVGLALAWFWLKIFPQSNRATGALLLAAAFPNATYLGLPVLESVLGESARAIAIQYDLLSCTPILLSGGVLIAIHFGQSKDHNPQIIKNLLRVPPLWAAIVGLLLNMTDIVEPQILQQLFEMLGNGVVPLMLFSIGLSLRWRAGWSQQLNQILPVVVIQLILTPLIIYWLIPFFSIDTMTEMALVLEAAMPSMVLGIVLADRYRLDSHLYAMAVTVTTVLSMITLPIWYSVLGG
ncbi:MAG: AEC family transporter [Gammaproteobacteria bacterium]|nr:AEC family transporter [Gammaproteobacteria bacterium]